MDIPAHLPSRIADYGVATPVSPRRVGEAQAATETPARSHAAVEYVVQGEVLEKRRAQAYDDDLLTAMRTMAREFRLHAANEAPPRPDAYAWGAVAAYRHTAVSTAQPTPAAGTQAVDYYV